MSVDRSLAAADCRPADAAIDPPTTTAAEAAKGTETETGLLTSESRFREGSTQADPDDLQVDPVCTTYGQMRPHSGSSCWMGPRVGGGDAGVER